MQFESKVSSTRAADETGELTVAFPRGKRASYVTRRIRDKIVSGELLPGSRINERVLSEELGISRTPLREAFKILEGEGLVAIKPNSGATVVAMAQQDVEHCLALLIGLEQFAAEQAAERATTAEIDEISSLHQEMVAAFKAGALMDYFHLNLKIHQKIIDAAKNPALSRVYAMEAARVVRFRFEGNRDHERWQKAVEEHEHILNALRDRQGPLLRELMSAHMRAGWRVARTALARQNSDWRSEGNV